MLDLLATSPFLFAAAAAIAGLAVAPLLDRLMHDLPRRIERQWTAECREFLQARGEMAAGPREETPIAGPARGSTPLRAAASVTAAITAWHFGFGLQGGAAILLTWVLLLLALIDLRTHLLPDTVTLPMLWLGLLLNLGGLLTTLPAAVLGAATGYLSLWALYHLFRLLTGREGMGYGDFKLLAMLGAWLGYQVLPLVILFSALLGAIAGLLLIFLGGHDRREPIPFGPWLAVAGWLALLQSELFIRIWP